MWVRKSNKREATSTGSVATLRTRGQALLLLMQYDATGDPRSLQDAIDTLHEVAARGSTVEIRTGARFLLGQALVRRFQATSSLTDLEWALRHMRQAVEEAPPSGEEERGPRLQQLAETLLTAVELMTAGEAPALVKGHLDYAEALLTESLMMAAPHRRATCGSSLGICHMLRFVHTGDGAPLGRALSAFSAALDVAPDAATTAAINGNIGKAWVALHSATGSSEALRQSLAAYRAAAAAAVPGTPDYDIHQRHLALAEDALEDAEAGRRAAGGADTE